MRAKILERLKTIGLLAIPLVMTMALTGGVSRVVADAELQYGEVAASKTIKAVDGKVNTWDLTFKIEARDNPNTTSDTVLVIDRSGSMKDEGRMTNAKKAANAFVDNLLTTSTNKIALVSFAGTLTNPTRADVTKHSDFTNNATSLKSAINSLSANGGTFTQAALKETHAIIANSTADSKNIVFLSDGEPTYCYAINSDWRNNSANLVSLPNGWNNPVTNNGYETPATVPETQFIYNNSNIVGSGNTMWSSYGTVGSWPDRKSAYYNCGNSAISEAGYLKNETFTNGGATKANIYSIAFGAGANGERVLKAVASGTDKYYGASGTTDLKPIFEEISGKIGASASDVSIHDELTAQFVAVNGTASDSGTINATNKEIDWTDITLGVPNEYGVRTATRTVRIALDPAYIFTANDGLFETNKSVSFNYTKPDGTQDNQTAPSPKVNPTLIHTKKVVNGSKAFETDKFNIKVVNNSSDFGSTFTETGEFTSSKAVNAGTYETSENITGTGMIGQYDVASEITGSYTDSIPSVGPILEISGNKFTFGNDYQQTTDANGTDNDIYVKYTNSAKLAKLAIVKVLGECTKDTNWNLSQSGKEFKFEVKNAKDVVVKNTSLKVTAENCRSGVEMSVPQGTYTITEEEDADYTTTNDKGNGNVGSLVASTTGTASAITFTNKYSAKRDITVNKKWVGGHEADYSATFTLYKDGVKMSSKTVIGNNSITCNNSITWENQPKGDSFGNLYEYTIKEDGNSSFDSTVPESGVIVDNTGVVNVTNTAKVGKIELHKTLGNDCQVPATSGAENGVTFNFEVKNQNNKVVASPSLTVSKDNCHARVALVDLPQGTYTITELGAEKYTTTYSVNNNGSYNGKVVTVIINGQAGLDHVVTFNNQFTEQITLQATKQWEGGSENSHTATFELWRDGSKIDGQDKTVTGNQTVTWTVPEADIYGNPYTYTVKETNVDSNYTSTCLTQVSLDGCAFDSKGQATIVNKYVIPTNGELEVVKNWIGGPTPRPVVTIELLQNGIPYDKIMLTDGQNSYKWTGLPETDINGNSYIYTVREMNVPDNYEMTQQGNTITNTYKSPQRPITATKEWNGGASPRPTIEFALYKQIGEAEPTPVLGVANKTLIDGQTSVTWENMDETDINGNSYTYSVKEVVTPPNYAVEENGLTVKNTFVSPKISITAEKIWEDGPAEHPEISLQLYQNGLPYGEPKTPALGAEGAYTATWEGLDEYDFNGARYSYRVNEVGVPADYNVSYSEDGLTVTNKYVIPTNAEATAKKVWVNGPTNHPTITFVLYRQIEGGVIRAVPGAEEKVLPHGVESVTWTNLERTDINGNPYTFSVKEKNGLDNYQTSVDGLTVTNKYVIPTNAEATAKKVWVDGSSIRPTVWFKLYRQVNGGPREAVDVEVKELPHGVESVTWTNLERTDINGNPYTFSVKEVNKEGVVATPTDYQVTYSDDGLTITNTYVSPLTSYSAKKIWEGGPDVRPGITLQLYRNGQPYGVPVKLGYGQTTYTWTGLSKTDKNGVEYTYTVDEVEVPKCYSKYVDGNRITNVYNCSPGLGGITQPVTPGQLPRSGASAGSFNPLMLLLVAMLAYTTTYFGQGLVLTSRQRSN